MTTVLLTGASGYIGKHVALELLRQGYTVRATVRSAAKFEEVQLAVAAHLGGSPELANRLQSVTLDLTRDEGWQAALVGCDVLLHTASPFTVARGGNPEILIRPAVDGTLRALRAAHSAGIRRVIVTSSVAAIYGHRLPTGVTQFDETMWTDVTSAIGRDAYTSSKTLAELAAWSFVGEHAPALQLTTINPGVVFGPPLDEHYGTSVGILERILRASDPAVPRLSFPIIDVRDVARLHVASITTEASVGQRFVAAERTMSFLDIATTLREAFPERRIVTRPAPSSLVRFLGLFDRQIRATVPLLGQPMAFNRSRTDQVFGSNLISAPQSIVETAQYLLQR